MCEVPILIKTPSCGDKDMIPVTGLFDSNWFELCSLDFCLLYCLLCNARWTKSCEQLKKQASSFSKQ